MAATAELQQLRALKLQRDNLDRDLATAEKAAKAEATAKRQADAELERTYANARSRVEAMRETLLQAQIDVCDSKLQYDATRAETIALERELTRAGLPIAQRLTAEEANWYTSTRLRDFQNRFKAVFANGQAI
jgi:hypothetical protein